MTTEQLTKELPEYINTYTKLSPTGDILEKWTKKDGQWTNITAETLERIALEKELADAKKDLDKLNLRAAVSDDIDDMILVERGA